jgi:hypothetical protein
VLHWRCTIPAVTVERRLEIHVDFVCDRLAAIGRRADPQTAAELEGLSGWLRNDSRSILAELTGPIHIPASDGVDASL